MHNVSKYDYKEIPTGGHIAFMIGELKHCHESNFLKSHEPGVNMDYTHTNHVFTLKKRNFSSKANN